MKSIIIVASILIFIGIILLCLKCHKGKTFLVRQFDRCNCIVFGKKGTGKDLLFNLAINSRKKPCYANIPYNEKYCETKQIKDFTVEPNTYENFLKDNVIIVQKTLEEKKDFYISDGGIVLPSQYCDKLVKNYPSLPIFYALSRHLTNSNIHINTQNLGRVWDKLREQADGYFKTTRTINIFGLLFTSYVYYDEYESAKRNLLPYKSGLFASAESRANKEEFESVNGRVEKFLVCQRSKHVNYDTRAYHKIIYGVDAPGSESVFYAKIKEIYKKILDKFQSKRVE